MLRVRARLVTLGMACLSVASASPLFAHPGSAIAVDRKGNVWFLDTGSGLWKIDADGVLHHESRIRFHWMALDESDELAAITVPRDVTRVRQSPTLLIASDYPLTKGTRGALVYPRRGRDGRVQLRRITAGASDELFATLPATSAEGQALRWINGIAGGPHGAIYFTENSAVRRVTAAGRIETVVRSVDVPGCRHIPGTGSDEGPFLRGLAVTPAGEIYVAASGCGSVLRVTPKGDVTVVLQLDAPWSPTAVAVAGSDLYVLEYLHTENEDRLAWLPRVRKVDSRGTSTILATINRN